MSTTKGLNVQIYLALSPSQPQPVHRMSPETLECQLSSSFGLTGHPHTTHGTGDPLDPRNGQLVVPEGSMYWGGIVSGQSQGRRVWGTLLSSSRRPLFMEVPTNYDNKRTEATA